MSWRRGKLLYLTPSFYPLHYNATAPDDMGYHYSYALLIFATVCKPLMMKTNSALMALMYSMTAIRGEDVLFDC